MSISDLNIDESLLEALENNNTDLPAAIVDELLPQALDASRFMAVTGETRGLVTAYALISLQHLLTREEKEGSWPRILVLTLSRDRAARMQKSLLALGDAERFRSAFLSGSMPYPAQIRMLKRNQDVLIGPPNRVLDHLRNERIDLSALEILILDRSERLVTEDQKEAMAQILEARGDGGRVLIFAGEPADELLTLGHSLGWDEEAPLVIEAEEPQPAPVKKPTAAKKKAPAKPRQKRQSNSKNASDSRNSSQNKRNTTKKTTANNGKRTAKKKAQQPLQPPPPDFDSPLLIGEVLRAQAAHKQNKGQGRNNKNNQNKGSGQNRRRNQNTSQSRQPDHNQSGILASVISSPKSPANGNRAGNGNGNRNPKRRSGNPRNPGNGRNQGTYNNPGNSMSDQSLGNSYHYGEEPVDLLTEQSSPRNKTRERNTPQVNTRQVKKRHIDMENIDLSTEKERDAPRVSGKLSLKSER